MVWHTKLLLNVIYITWMLVTGGTNGKTRSTKFTQMKGYRYVTYTVRILDVSDVTTCGVYCNDVLNCTASSYNKDEGLCRLTDIATGAPLELHNGWDLYIATERLGDTAYSGLNVTATQSTTYTGASASRAVDGNLSSDWMSRSCTATDSVDDTHWWRLDFGALLLVGRVVIYNRDDCCEERLRYLTLSIAPTIQALNDTAHVCATLETYPGTNPVTLTCALKMVGQYLQIYKDVSRETLIDDRMLTLCEVMMMP